MIAVTGHRGFVGRAVCAELERQSIPFCCPSGDLSDPSHLAAQLDGVHTLIHLAVRQEDRDGSGFAVNPALARSVVAACRERAVVRIIASSSAGIYGHQPLRDATEATPIDPDTPLSRSRAEAEAVLLDSGIDTVLLRTRFVYGTGDSAFLPRLHRAMADRPLGFGASARLSLIAVDDLARIAVAAIDAPPPPGPVVHCTDGVPMPLQAVVQRLCAAFGGRPPRLWAPAALAIRPIEALERLRGRDPRTHTGSLSSVRLRLVTQDQFLSSNRLNHWLPDFRATSFDAGLANLDWSAS